MTDNAKDAAPQSVGVQTVEERARCIAICEGWLDRFKDTDIQYTSAREYAADAISDIIDLIREGKTTVPTDVQPSAPDLPAEEAAGKTATRLLDLWSEIAGAENFGPYHDTMAFLGKPNSVGWVWAHEVRFERDFDAEQERTRKLCLDSVTATEEENEELRAALANRQPSVPVWLVEWPEDDNVPVRWWNPVHGWMRDANKALHFVRKSDVEDYIAAGKWVTGIRATEHKFVSAVALANGQPTSGVREQTIEECAKVAFAFNAACNSPRMSKFVEAGLVQEVYNRDFAIGNAIRALAAAPPARSKMAQRAPNTNPHATWQTVPLPATSEMTAAAELVDAEMRRQGFANAEPEAIYYAMLDAAPSPPVQGSSEDCASAPDEIRIAFGVATTQTLLDPQRRFEAIQKVQDYLRGLRAPGATALEDGK